MLTTLTMEHIGNEQHFKVPVSFHQSVDEAHGFNGMNVVVNVSVLNKQVPFESVSHGYIRLCGIVALYRISLVQLVPPCLIQTGIVITGDRNPNFIEIWKCKHGVSRTIAASRSPVDSDSVHIHV